VITRGFDLKTALKLSSEERRAAIIRAVRRVFAEKGFHGTTTRALAEAAGVSEALLFKHFPNKEALYSAMQLFCCNENDPEKIDRIKALEPSTSTLVLIVHLMVARTVGSEPGSQEDAVTHHRLMLRSMIEDGEFARLFYERTMPCWISKVEECLKASIAAGDATEGPVRHNLGALFARHLAKTIMVSLLPATPIVDYGMPREKLVEQVVWFTLRGVGVRDEAIKRYYNPEALRVLMA
jgi:AcrR family transcriptional regulator